MSLVLSIMIIYNSTWSIFIQWITTSGFRRKHPPNGCGYFIYTQTLNYSYFFPSVTIHFRKVQKREKIKVSRNDASETVHLTGADPGFDLRGGAWTLSTGAGG